MSGGEKSKKILGTDNRVLRICRLLNEHSVKYIIVGGVAANLHGTFRSTRDIDLLVPKETKNMERLLQALLQLPHGIARELDAKEIVTKIFTIVGDDPRVDILTVAGKTTYEKAKRNMLTTKISNVEIPYLSLKDLISSKDTGRTQDLADLEILKTIQRDL